MQKKKKKWSLRSLSGKFLVPTLFLIIIAIVLLSMVGYFTVRSILLNSVEERSLTKLEEMQQTIEERKENALLMQQAIDKNLLTVAKLIERSIRDIPEDSLNQELEIWSEQLGIEEIHVIDGYGILRWTSNPALLGYDFASDPQSAVFLDGLYDSTFALAQEGQKRGADGQFFKYVGVARQDRSGVVQIGVEPTELEKVFDKIDITHLASSMIFGQEGYVYVLDLEGNILSHPDPAVIGTNVTQFDWGQEIVEKKSGQVMADFQGQQLLNHFDQYDSYIIGTALPTNEYMGNIKQYRDRIIWVTLIVLVIAVIVILWVTQRFTRPILRATTFAQEIAQGNLREEDLVYTGEDEIGQLTSALNAMQSNLKEMIGNMTQIIEHVAASSEELSAAGEQVGEIAEQVGSSIQTVASGAEEQSAQIEDTAKSVKGVIQKIGDVNGLSGEMQGAAEQVMLSISKGNDAVNNSITQISHVKQDTSEVAQVVKNLGNASNEIGKIIELINGIATQTNLLALNAAIEAARAGEAGRGFSVVADEIRQLAVESADATNRIGGLLQEIQNGAADAVKRMDTGVQTVENSVQAIEENRQIFKEINGVVVNLQEFVEKVAGRAREIADDSQKVENAISEIASVSLDFAGNAEEVAASSEEQISSTEEIVGGAKRLADLAEELAKLADKFEL